MVKREVLSHLYIISEEKTHWISARNVICRETFWICTNAYNNRGDTTVSNWVLINEAGQKITCEAASHWMVALSSGSPPKAPQPQFPVTIPIWSWWSTCWIIFPPELLIKRSANIPSLDSEVSDRASWRYGKAENTQSSQATWDVDVEKSKPKFSKSPSTGSSGNKMLGTNYPNMKIFCHW